MRAWLPAIAFGAVVALAATGAILALRPGPAVSGAERADALAAELRCPDCQALSVADSPTQSAQEIRRQIEELIAAGSTDDEVRAHFVARYGDWIRLAPSATVFWLIPFAIVGAGAVGLGTWLIRRRPPMSPALAIVTARQRARVREEAEALDA